MLTCAIVTAVISIAVAAGLHVIAAIFHTDALTKEYFCTYYGLLILELPLMVVNSAFGMFIRGEGNPMFVMLSNIVMVVLNIILDFLFVGPFGWGMEGIAWASLISAFVVTIMCCLYFFFRAKVFRFGAVTFDWLVMKETIFNGSSEFIGELSMCISMAAYNYEVLKYAGVDGVAAFTIIGYVSYVFSMIIIGFGQGIVPLISYSYGGRQYQEMKKVRTKTIKMVVIVAVIVFGILCFFMPAMGGLLSIS